MVKEKVPETQECPSKFYGWEDKEYWEDYWENIEPLKKSININTTNSILEAKETCTKIKLYWSKLSTSLKPKNKELINLKLNRKLEEKKMLKLEKENSAQKP
jgi:hypothetical protein